MSKKFALQHKDYLIEAYVEKCMSPYQIAKELNTYPNMIRRSLQHLNVDLRGHSEAQKTALETGAHPHPTKGKSRSEETKAKISDKVHEHWQNLSDDEKEKISQRAKEKWDEKSEHEKNVFMNAALDGVRKAGKEGSKIEKSLREGLTKAGYDSIPHKTDLIPDNKLEVDIFVPSLNTAIEVDGPSHFKPIWGEDNLQKHINADAKKAGLLIQYGYCLVRVKLLENKSSLKYQREVTKKVIIELEKIKKKFPTKTKRFIEIEVS